MAWSSRIIEWYINVATIIPNQLALVNHVLKEASELVGFVNMALHLVHLLLHFLKLLHLLVDLHLLDSCFLLLLLNFSFGSSTLGTSLKKIYTNSSTTYSDKIDEISKYQTK